MFINKGNHFTSRYSKKPCIQKHIVTSFTLILSKYMITQDPGKKINEISL